MKKIILSTVLIFCFGLSYGQDKQRIGWEQETVFNELAFKKSSLKLSMEEINIEGRLCRIYTKQISKKSNRTTIEEVIVLLSQQKVRFDYLPREMILEFYFTDEKEYQPSFVPSYPTVEQYDGLTQHQVMVLTRMSDWSPVCKIMISKVGAHKAFLKNRLIYAMGRVILEYKQQDFFWDPNSVLNDPNEKKVSESFQDFKKFGNELNRFAGHSTKAFVGELFAYAVVGELEQVLPRDITTANRARKFYFNDCMGPMCLHLERK